MTAYTKLRATVLPLVPASAYAAQLVWRRARLWRRAGAIFVHVPKNGGTSICAELYGGFIGHIAVRDILRFAPSDVAALPRLALVRNPWDRLLSAYRFATSGVGQDALEGQGMSRPERYRGADFASFEHFVLDWLPRQNPDRVDPVFRPQVHYLLDQTGHLRVDHLGRFERFDEFALAVSDVMGREVRFPHLNHTTSKAGYPDHYSKEMRDTAADFYKRDIEAFDYEF